jgi:hypothetical protein
MAATVVRSDQFRQEFAPQIADRFIEGFAAETPIDRERLDTAVNTTLSETAFVAAFTETLGTVWRVFVGVGVVLRATGLVTHPKTPVAFRRLSLLFAIGAGLQLGATWVVVNLAAPSPPINGLQSIAPVILDTVLARLQMQVLVLGIAALGVAAVATLWIWIPPITAPARVVRAAVT